MKKYFSFSVVALLVTVFCIGFTSCSDDDDDGGGNSSFAINNEKFSIIDVGFERSKNSSNQYQYCLSTTFGVINSPSNFEMYWKYGEISFESLKVGDELPMPFYSMSYWEKAYNLYDDTRHCKYVSGTITVESIDTINKSLKVRFRDFKIMKNGSTELTIKGDLNVDHFNW